MKTYADLLAETSGAVGLHPDVEDRDERDQWVKDATRGIFLKKGQFIRTLIIRANTQPRHIVSMTQDLPQELAHMGGEIGRSFAAAMQATQIYVAMEAWYVDTKDPEEQKRLARGEAPSIPARDHPDRKEALLILCEDPWTDPIIRNWKAEIARDAKGKPSVGPWQADALQIAAGRMTYLLPPEAYLAAGRKVPKA